jgi:PhnB protein
MARTVVCMDESTSKHTPPVAPIPPGYNAVSPWVITADTARMLEFLVEAFEAVELGRVESEDGSIGHAEARIGDSIVLLFDKRPDWRETPAFVRLYVADGDAVFTRAIAAGATAVTEMTELFWGDRVGRVRDPLGNLWWIQTRVADLSPEEMMRRAALPEFVEAMAYVQSAEVGLSAADSPVSSAER